jgi:hypothetical protein
VLVASPLAACSLFNHSVDVLYIGDSIMAQTGPYAQGALTTGPPPLEARTQVDALSGSGLLTRTPIDWQRRARELIGLYHPKVVVVLFVGNYSDTDLWTGADGQPVPNDYGDRFFDEWGKQADKLTATLSSGGAKVDWVLPPPLVGAEGHRREVGMRNCYDALAGRVSTISLIDSLPALGGDAGEWVPQRLGVDGNLVTVREADSVHLTEEGGRLLARQIAQTVGPQLSTLRAQKA